jgi:serum/glucocorticoid-regulated kinase 2
MLIKKRKNGFLYAMKVIRKEKVSKNEKIIEATLLEKKILMKSKHPFIVKMYKSFQTERKLYIIMEYMPNGDLYSVL